MKPVILIMAGGTGGHIFPAIAVANALEAQGFEIHWLGSQKGLETELVPKQGFTLHPLPIKGLRGQGLARLLKAPWVLAKALVTSLRLIRRLKPRYVVGFGGFASGPGGLAAKLLGVQLALHEQNAVAGLTNRLLSRFADPLMQAFPGALTNAITLGNPVREDLCQLPKPSERWANRKGPIRLLVLGGSLGALAINEALPKAIQLLEPKQRPEIWHQCGARHFEVSSQHYQLCYPQARVSPFIEDMAEAFAWADLVLCRAGALTVSEIAAAGIAALFIPYPYAVDDHQTKNAQWLVDAGAADILPQSELTPATLAHWLQQHAQDRTPLLAKAERAYAIAKRNATQAVVENCMRHIQHQQNPIESAPK
jgi:UDP-N-acetylglucosamine--N-acetylmuramyl-(pentapeptide) pyrophosphoryl-undecaprenol N-acetylglucosamine transferase